MTTLDAAGTVLWDVDTQRDFCDADGRLFVPGADAPALRERMAALVAWARAAGVPHVASSDDHLHADAEIADAPDWETTFPAHCLRGTRGAERIPETALADPLPLAGAAETPERIAELLGDGREILLHKHELDVFTNPNAERLVAALGIAHAVVFGVATDLCVDRTAMGLRRMGVRVTVAEDACAGLDAGRVAACRRAWDEAGIALSSTADVIRGGAGTTSETPGRSTAAGPPRS
jgi:nicotinamidase/pyrazinamidase